MGAFAEGAKAGDKTAGLGAVADLRKRNNIDPADVGRVERISVWESGDNDHVAVQLSPSWEDDPEWPAIQPVTPARISYGRRPKPLADEYHRTVLFPDPQIGYWRDLDTGDLTPMHDEQAMSCALEIAKAVRPDRIVNLGDYIDMAEWTLKHAVHPEFVHTTQAAINYGHEYLAHQRAILGPNGTLVLIPGNHDVRAAKMVAKNAMAALRLKRADAPDSWPVLSLANLLALDVLDCEYISGYPARSYKLADGDDVQTPLYAVHERGLDVAKVAKSQRQSYVQGHTHKVAVHAETYELNDGPIEVEAWSLGSLCRRDGAVPSTKGATDDRGHFTPRIEAWQQALGVLTVAPSGAWNMEVVRIRNGRAFYGGKVYSS